MKKDLIEIANHLLDLGKRNRLLNFKASGLKSINILNKNIEEIFIDITNSKTYNIKLIDGILKKYHNDLIINPDEDDILNYSELKVYDIVSPSIKNNELLCYNKGYSLDKSLKALLKDYKYSITEKGINSLYISFGFVKYVEDKEYLAPLLLIPVSLECDIKGNYKIKEYDDEIILNPTLKYYFKNNYKISLDEYDLDMDLNTYFNKIKKALNPNMALELNMALGIYSFLKMNMYNDIVDNIDTVYSNNNVKALLNDSNASDLNYDLKSYPVVNYDSSQLLAINMAAKGKSFVLEGPPGSGKSQTITNIISTLLGNGKHILFVSEKLAALKVVYENLRRSNLNEFAIEIHSSKANKKDFIDELYKTAIKDKYILSNKANDVNFNHEIVSGHLKDYINAINKKIDDDNSLYDLISKYLEIDIDEIDYQIKFDNYSIVFLNEALKLLDDYDNLVRPFGYDYKEIPFYGMKRLDNDYVRYHLLNDAKDSVSYLKNLIKLKDVLNKYIKLNSINIKDIYNSFDLISALTQIKTYDPIYLKKDKRDLLIKYISKYLEINKSLNKKALNNYNDAILKEDLNDILIKYKEVSVGFFKFLNKDYKKLNRKILAYRNTKAKPKTIIAELIELIELNKKLKELKKLKNSIKDIASIERSNYSVVLADLRSLNNVSDIDLSSDDYLKLKPYFIDVLISFKSYQNESIVLNRIANSFDGAIFNLLDMPIEASLTKLNLIISKIDLINDYYRLVVVIDELKKNNIIDYLDYSLKQGVKLDNLKAIYNKLYLKEFIYNIIDNNPILKGFNSYDALKNNNDFIKLDEEILNINRDYIIYTNSLKRPNDMLVEGSKFKILINEYNKVKRKKPIRLLLDQIFDLALDIKPVFLMSPLSVSTYLNNKCDLFDCVIFDEASQIYASDAIGAIYRAKQCIIIGDTKQMPPSSFFMAQSLEEEDNDEVFNDSSILDMAHLSFTSERLKWHYRSRSEELITFSNKTFYDSSLITIPQSKNHELGFGIDRYYLENGRYDMKTRTNLVEANFIKDMVFKHYKESNLSLGVVAFSEAQARLIEDLILDEAIKYKDIYNKMFENENEPFFVKNLESVQGDERDRIIFSICYGYNDENKFYQRFGPLNNLGGEKRLNVAITRAKVNICVVTSIKSSDIKLKNTESIGVKALHDYLEFIEDIRINKNYNSVNVGIYDSIKNYLKSIGYDAVINYGNSNFKIDLAVMKDNKFILAIMLDHKKNYKTNLTDEYRLEKMLLERLGWKYYKLYSVSWFLNKKAEELKLYNAIAGNDKIIETDIDDNYLIKDDNEYDLKDNFKDYKYYNAINTDDIKDLIYNVIKTEEPIAISYLQKRIANILGLNVTNVLKNKINKNMPEDVLLSNDFYYIRSKNKDLRINSDRNIKEIAESELQNGLYIIIKDNNGITPDGAYRALIKLLGYQRLTDDTKKILDNIIVFMKLDGLIIEKNNCLFIS